jgi:colanic acid/amylovoran biosynthesis protein
VRIVVLGDLGQRAYHVGDEAMTVAAIDELGRRTGAEFIALSRDPAQTSALYGVRSIRTLEFPWPPAERSSHLELVRRAAGGDRDALPADSAVWQIMDEVRLSDGVLIAGGGNMNSLFGWLLYERAALGLIAEAFDKPLVIGGQTFGPALLPQDREVLRGLLSSAALAGAREPTSYALGLELGLSEGRLVPVVDDGSFISASDPAQAGSPAPAAPAGTGVPAGRFIAATIGPDAWREGMQTLADIAGVLDRAAELTGLPVYLVPHMGPLGPDGEGGDHQSHRTVLESSRSGRLLPLPVLPVRTAAAVTQSAQLVITNRYHPAVFALAAGVPAVTLSNDAYSDVRLEGALGNWGLADWALPLPSLASGGLDEAVTEAWARRDEIRNHLEKARPDLQRTQAQWWDAVAGVFAGTTVAAAASAPPAPLGADADWARQATAQRVMFRTLSSGIGRLWTEWDDVRSERDRLQQEKDEALNKRSRTLGSRSFGITSAFRAGIRGVRRLGRKVQR